MELSAIGRMLGALALFSTWLCFAEEATPMQSVSPVGAKLYFITPSNGDQLKSPVTVKFGLAGMGVAPAGVNNENTGHHHLLIDVDKLPDLTMPLPASEQVKHFGKGQTETEISLPPGQHTLQLLLGNYLHIPHNPPVMSDKITITVSE